MLYEKTGLTRFDKDRATPGFTLFSPLQQRKTLILNMRGEVVHDWNLPAQPGNYTYLLPNGNLLIVGEKQVGVNQTVDSLRFSGVIDPRQIRPPNMIAIRIRQWAKFGNEMIARRPMRKSCSSTSRGRCVA